ncbi:response regulator [Candidatus Obscuribacterales bacterium]|nr:response regulator [Candidatus Obscuribacterales bacterium]
MPKKQGTTNNRLAEGLSEVIRERRLELGLSQSELSNQAGLHRTYISEVERGTQNLTIETLGKLADALGTSVLLLVEDASQATRYTDSAIRILLAEDSAADIHMVERSLKASKLPTVLTVLTDGRDTIDYLAQKEKSSELPDLILLDLHLPKKNGYEILREIKVDDRLKHIPVVVLTNSESNLDVSRTYELHANTFITKPVSQKKFQEAILRVLDYWFGLASLPQA